MDGTFRPAATQPPESPPGENEIMLLTSPLAAENSRCSALFAGLEIDRSFVAGATVVREVPVRLRWADSIDGGRELQQHYDSLQVEGPAGEIPAEIEVDVRPIAMGGQISIDSVVLPSQCEVIGVWFTNPLVTVSAR